MKKALIMLLVLLLCGCSATQSADTPAPTPSPQPTPEPSEYVITNESRDEILALGEIKSLRRIDAKASREYDALLELCALLPDCEIYWEYELQGEVYGSDTSSLKCSSLEGLEDAVRYLPELEYIDLLEAGADVEDLDRLSAINPDIFFLWEFKHDGFTIRTDIQVYSSLRGRGSRRFTDEDMYPMLKYCTKLRALDLGHCDLRDISLIGELEQLEVLILADNPNLVDASPIGNLENLIYMELFQCDKIEDYSFLNKLSKMKDLNLCYDPIPNLDFLENMPDISFLMVKYTGIDKEEIEYWKEIYPDTRFVLYDGNIHSCDSGWRETVRNSQIRYSFSGWRHVLEYRSYDDVDYNFGGYVYK